jgi:hypothetical protein
VSRAGAKTLSDVAAPMLTIACAPCNRRGVYSVARAIAKHGDAKISGLRVFLSADCPKRGSTTAFRDRCQAVFERVEYRRE